MKMGPDNVTLYVICVSSTALVQPASTTNVKN
jgi:hypothetical protein